MNTLALPHGDDFNLFISKMKDYLAAVKYEGLGFSEDLEVDTTEIVEET